MKSIGFGYHQKAAIKKDEIIEDNKSEVSLISSNKSQTLPQLKEQCKSLGIKGYSKLKKDELIQLINKSN